MSIVGFITRRYAFARKKLHVNGIESLEGFARRFAKFKGLINEKFLFHLKECEFRFNHRHENIEQGALKIMKKSGIC